MFNELILVSLFCCLIASPVPQYVPQSNKTIDWRTKGAVLPVSNQGDCGDSTVINALDAITAANQIKGRKLVRLSSQQIYDCGSPLCPCKNNTLGASFIYELIYNQGLDTKIDSEESYPYTGKCTKKCNFKKSGVVTGLSFFNYNIQNNSENSLYGLLEKGPVVVGVESNSRFQTYTGGIFEDSSNKGSKLNHSLLLVGYGTEKGVDYWIARNSWGTNWGEKGFIRIVRDKNMCGIGNRWVQPSVI